MDEQQKRPTFLQLIAAYRWFIFMLMFALGLAGIFSLRQSQATLFLGINKYHHETANELFKLITHMGDWPFTVFLAAICLFFKIRYAIVLIGSMLYTGFYTQVLKIIVQAPRPYVYFQEIKQTIHTIDQYVLENSLSFPSGHTTCVFSLAIALCYVFRHKAIQFAVFFMALTVAFSRVYLAQHFFIDLMAGSIIGTFGGLHLIWLLQGTSWFSDPRLEQGLASRIAYPRKFT